MPEPEPVANYHCHTGENPLWDEREQRVYWVDIPPGKLYRADAAGAHELFFRGPEPIGGFTLQEDGSLLLFEVDGFSRLSKDGVRTRLVSGVDPDMERFNDVIADPEGRVFAGTIGRDDRRGGLYRVDRGGRVTRLFQGTGISNGMGFTTDLKRFYWTCSTTRRIYRFDYGRASGELSRRTLWYEAPEGEGTPDGMAVDEKGDVWTARWDGFALLRLSPEGERLEKIAFPVGKVSSAAFGGERLDTLYVTTAGGAPDADTADGTLYRVRVGVPGRPEFRSRITPD